MAQGRALVAVDSAEVGDDLVADVTEILTSLCARLPARPPIRCEPGEQGRPDSPGP